MVGNSAYEHIAPLRNPKNDAGDLTARLEGLGFQVFGGTDLDRRALVQALIQFGRAAERKPRSRSSSMPGTGCR